jgi:hypothetical protein
MLLKNIRNIGFVTAHAKKPCFDSSREEVVNTARDLHEISNKRNVKKIAGDQMEKRSGVLAMFFDLLKIRWKSILTLWRSVFNSSMFLKGYL